MNIKKLSTYALMVGALVAVPGAVFAATTANSQLTQQINAGVLSTSIRDASGVVVGSPSFAMSAVSVSTALQTSTGTFGTNSQRITADNPGASNSGFTLTLASTNGVSSTWVDGAKTYPYNAATAASGQLTINPSVATLTPTSPATSTGITLGSSATYVSGTVNTITLLNAAAGSDDIWNGYITGVGVSQTIPAFTAAGNYTLDMTQTITAQ